MDWRPEEPDSTDPGCDLGRLGHAGVGRHDDISCRTSRGGHSRKTALILSSNCPEELAHRGETLVIPWTFRWEQNCQYSWLYGDTLASSRTLAAATLRTMPCNLCCHACSRCVLFSHLPRWPPPYSFGSAGPWLSLSLPMWFSEGQLSVSGRVCSVTAKASETEDLLSYIQERRIVRSALVFVTASVETANVGKVWIMQGKGRIAFAISREGKSSTYSGISLFCEGEKKGLSSEKRMATEKSRVSKEKKKKEKRWKRILTAAGKG